MDKEENLKNTNNVRTRHMVHISFSLLMFLVIVVFNALNDDSVVSMIFRIASYTYGPLLGLYSFGLFMKNLEVRDRLVPVVCLAAPFITLFLSINSATFFGNYVFDVELILVNGIITFLLLLAISKKHLPNTDLQKA